jgi:tellurium resistance protein TerD
MSVMKRGTNVALTQEIPGLTGVVLGVSWNAGAETALDESLVLATILCDQSSRALSDEHFVFFNQLSSPDVSVQHVETALGGDKEQVEVHFAAVPPEVERIVVVLYVNEGPMPRRTLGQLRGCVLRVLNLDSNVELVRSEDFAPLLEAETGIALGEIYRHGRDWKFKVLGAGYPKGIAGIASDYGLSL